MAPAIGVFDSGIGGLSVLRALRQAMPGAHYIYLADNAWAPYGERPAEALRERINLLVEAWRMHHALDLLVLACNTATAVAIDALRQAHPDLPIVGVEPAIRPALAATRTGHIGVLATHTTLQSTRYQALRSACLIDHPGLQIHDHPASGLADAIERGDDTAVQALCSDHLGALLARAPTIDVLVLGCTHYPLAESAWHATCPAALKLIDPATAVARRTRSLLPHSHDQAAPITWHCTGDTASLTRAARRWIALDACAQRPAFNV